MSATYEKVLRQLVKRAYTPGAEMAGGGMPPMDPSMMQGGGTPPMDPAMMQGGGMPPMDPSMMQGGMDPSMMQGGMDPMMMPITELTVGDLAGLIAEIVSEVSGGAAPVAEPKKDTPAAGTAPGNAEVVDRLDQILQLLGGGAEAAAPMGPMDGPVAPGMGAPKIASATSTKSIADMIIERMKKD